MAEPNTQPIFVREPLPKGYRIATANTNLDGTGVIVPIARGGEFGARVDAVTIVAGGNTTAGQVRFFIRDEENVWRLYDVVAVTSATVGATVPPFTSTWTPESGVLTLAPEAQLGASTYNAETFYLHPEGGQY